MAVGVRSPWKVYFDGATYRDGVGAGIVFVTPQEEVIPYSFTLTNRCSNNVAKYQALILRLEMAIDMKQLQLQVFGDSQLVIKQLLGSYEVRKPELRPYHKYARKLIGWLGEVTLHPSKMQKNIESPDGTIKMQRGGVSDSGGDGHIDTGDGAIGSITSCGDFGGGGHSGGDGC
ncbi:uncharacterized protein LOC124896670 [Capsicum annuum]|uniref:uncharacterized protein LOC124896670 n=1 Tax=Capsicum annuum TaxID=4072 RepID=UPI001FB085FD|nr:uncharacterized protein LOC124896670 [Capsicum annuum]